MEIQSVCVEKYAFFKGNTCKETGKPMLTLRYYTHTKRYTMTTGKRSIDFVEHYTQHSRSQKPKVSACSQTAMHS